VTSLRSLVAAASLGLISCQVGDTSTRAADSPPAESLGLGRPATPQEIAAVDLDVGPTGVGLPPGEATATSGTEVYMTKCAGCHGQKGEGIAPSPPVVGRIPGDSFPFGRDGRPVKTVGNYWPYATTLFDYTRRAMPITEPGTLEPEEVYGVVAWILAENGIIGRDEPMNAETLPKVRMPARDRFVRDDRGGKIVR
jgi:cytochrome c